MRLYFFTINNPSGGITSICNFLVPAHERKKSITIANFEAIALSCFSIANVSYSAYICRR